MRTQYLKKLNQLDRLVFLVLGVFCWTGSVFAAPALSVTSDKGPWHPGRHYRIFCEVSWSGNAGDYAILPAEPGKMDWATVTLVCSEAMVRNGVQIVRQTLDVVPTKTGEFSIPEIRVVYLNPETTSPAEKAVSGTTPSESSASPSLRSDPFMIVVHPARTLFWISGGLGAPLLLIVLGWWFVRYRTRRAVSTPHGASRADTRPAGSVTFDIVRVQTLLRDARTKQMNGDFYGFYLVLAQAASAIPGASSLVSLFEKRGQEVGYQGMRPTPDMMDGDVREIERTMAHLLEEKDNAP